MKPCNLLITTFLFTLAIQAVNTLDCEAGKFDNGVACQDCSDNTWSDGNQTSCEECTNCTQCDATNGECTQCPPGQEVDTTNGTCSECAPLTFSLGVQCQDCNDTCLTCNSSNGNCLSCNNGSGLNDNKCQKCSGNQFTNTTTYLCSDCDSSCATCSGPSNSECTDCNTNFTLFNGVCVDSCGIDNCVECTNNSVCTKCTTNYILLGSSCIASCSLEYNCSSCASGFATCATCDTGLVLSSDKTQCVSCNVANCVSCLANDYCGVCTNDIFPHNGQCFTCQVDNCQSCGSNSSCNNCNNGYQINPSPSGTDDQCIACFDPCQTCYSDGSCKTCQTPYSQMELTPNSQCFLCHDPRCMTCSDAAEGSCTVCNTLFTVVSGKCEYSCGDGCTACTQANNVTTCTACLSFFYSLQNGSCAVCNNSPICLHCQENPQICTQCYQGFYLKNGSCYKCPGYCAKCDSDNPSYCIRLIDIFGNTLIDTGLLYSATNTSNYPAACDPQCITCSTAYPSKCIVCFFGFYLNDMQYCSPCTYESKCQTCVSANPSQCLTCWAGMFLNDTTNKCQSCTFPCTACKDANATACSACAQGYVLKNDTCQLASTFEQDFGIAPIPNCAKQMETTNSSNAQVVVCQLCDQGYTQTSDGCVPCSLGCQVCSSENIFSCIKCMTGYYLNGSNICVSCQENCVLCTEQFGCLQCKTYYVLNHDQKCQKICMTPCATCSSDNPLTCLTCLAGYTMVNGECTSNLTCNDDASCLTCPYGYSITKNNNDTKLSMTCTQCKSESRCARCNTSNTQQCYSCDYGFYLKDNICVACPEGCQLCISANQCVSCAAKFVPVQTGAISGNDAAGLVNCTPCVSPCEKCEGSPNNCLSCVNGFNLRGSVCISSFRFVVRIVLNVTLAEFQSNYFNFVQAIATEAGVNFNDIVINSITSGSVIVDMSITSSNPSGSNAAQTILDNLNGLFNSGTIAGMKITSFTVTTEGGDGGDDGGLSKTTIIILATVIPIGTLLIVGIIVIIYCVHKRRKEQEAGMNEWNSAGGNTTGRNIELSTNNDTKRAYL